MRYIFKDQYTDYNGKVTSNTDSYYFCPLVTSGSGSKTSPNPSRNNSYNYPKPTSIINYIFSAGKSYFSLNTQYEIDRFLIGSGMGKTLLTFNRSTNSGGNSDSFYFKDISLTGGNINTTLSAASNYRFVSCEIRKQFTNISTTRIVNVYFTYCRIKDLTAGTNYRPNYQNNNSFVGISTGIGWVAGNLHTFEKCNLVVNQASLDSYKNNYYAFDNCNFRIGTETDYAPLTGTTADELRASFVARCTAAGLTVPADITDFGITLTLGRWLFTKDQIFEGVTWKGSEINLFEVPRLISFGYSDTIDKIGVTIDNNIPGTFSPAFPNSGNLDFQTGGVYLPYTDDITDLHSYSMASNFIFFGAKKQFTRLMLVDNLPAEYGVKADSTQDLLSGSPIAPGGAISPGVYYIVRSSDKQPATISYNGATYSTSLNTRNNLLLGVAAATTFTATSGNPVLYQVNDELQYKTLQVRVMNKIPADIIKTGALLAGYWYIVEHDTDQSNATDYVTYNGVNYYTGSSFLVDADVTAFTVTGTTHLRRICKDDFDWDTEAVDKDFWEFTQKPEWVDVIDGDPRCLLHNNHDLAHEMQRDASGNYIASGHPDFYKIITGEAGILMKPQPIKGAYMQVRVVVSTLNVM